jgi:Uma2 family endonuclease
MTVDEYLPADLPEGYRYELVNGVVEMSPPPNPIHDTPLQRVTRLLHQYDFAYPGTIAYMTPNAGVVVPDEDTVREPEFALYREWPGDVDSFEVCKEYVPFLVIEVVSRGQGRRDYEDKRKDYLKAGVDEYWIIDPHKRRVTVLTRRGRAWRERTFSPEDTYSPKILPQFELPVRLVLTGK